MSYNSPELFPSPSVSERRRYCVTWHLSCYQAVCVSATLISTAKVMRCIRCSLVLYELIRLYHNCRCCLLQFLSGWPFLEFLLDRLVQVNFWELMEQEFYRPDPFATLTNKALKDKVGLIYAVKRFIWWMKLLHYYEWLCCPVCTFI